jgi:hypothetical protein
MASSVKVPWSKIGQFSELILGPCSFRTMTHNTYFYTPMHGPVKKYNAQERKHLQLAATFMTKKDKIRH